MTKKLLMGNQAMAYGALAAGVNVVAGYPGTPSSEVLETVAKLNPGNAVHVEWSTNEKAAMEVAAGASYCGARALVTMKMVGLNVASDPLMSLNYVGVKGGLVVLVADDPGPISSQTEQDTRRFAAFAKIPVFDPASPEEAYQMMQDAFELSERYHTPVFLRPTTRVCHGSAAVDVAEPTDYVAHDYEGFVRDSKWVIFPRRAYQGHCEINERLPQIAAEFCGYAANEIVEIAIGRAKIAPMHGIVCNGISYAYVREALEVAQQRGLDLPPLRVFKVATPYPFPETLATGFLERLSSVIVFEELDHVLEDELLKLVGSRHLSASIHGKLTGEARAAGENTVESVLAELCAFLGVDTDEAATAVPAAEAEAPKPPARPPVLCAGCPHRGAFTAVKLGTIGRKAYYCGDIGCYTLGNAKPLDMCDTCLCMGADITIAQGMRVAEPDASTFAFIGDSTFFASGMTGVANAVYNGNKIVICVLDNSTTAMTGHQPHPGTGIRMTNPTERDGERALKIPEILHALGVASVQTVNPFDLEAGIAAVQKAIDVDGVSAIIFKAPCIALAKPGPKHTIDPDACRRCRVCINTLGCPAIQDLGGKILIDPALCYGCSLCLWTCRHGAITLADGAEPPFEVHPLGFKTGKRLDAKEGGTR